MMANDSDSDRGLRETVAEQPVEMQIVALALTIGVVLLAAPFAPPQAAIFGFVVIVALGLAIYWGYALIAAQAASVFESDDAGADAPVSDEERVRQQYLDGELDDIEFERELERVIETEDDNEY